eukprot:PhM_4_TR8428/c0_g2_i4/m.55320/K00888/PI4KA; phosphatidylinositol 4-kinase A
MSHTLDTSLELAEVLAEYCMRPTTTESDALKRIESFIELLGLGPSELCQPIYVACVRFVVVSHGMYSDRMLELALTPLPRLARVIAEEQQQQQSDSFLDNEAEVFVSALLRETCEAIGFVSQSTLRQIILTLSKSMTLVNYLGDDTVPSTACLPVVHALHDGTLGVIDSVLESTTSVPLDLMASMEVLLLRSIEASARNPAPSKALPTALDAVASLLKSDARLTGPKARTLLEKVLEICRAHIQVSVLLKVFYDDSVGADSPLLQLIVSSMSLLPLLSKHWSADPQHAPRVEQIEAELGEASKLFTRPIGLLSEATPLNSEAVLPVARSHFEALLTLSKRRKDHRYLNQMQGVLFSPASFIFQFAEYDPELVAQVREVCMTCLCSVLCDTTITSPTQVSDYTLELINRLVQLDAVGGSEAHMLGLMECAERVVCNYDGDRRALVPNVSEELSDVFSRPGTAPHVQDLCIRTLCRITASTNQSYTRCADLLLDNYTTLVRSAQRWDLAFHERLAMVGELLTLLIESPECTPASMAYIRSSVLEQFTRLAWPQSGVVFQLHHASSVRPRDILTQLLPCVRALVRNVHNRRHTMEHNELAVFEKEFRTMWLLWIIHDVVGISATNTPDETELLLAIVRDAPPLLRFTSVEIVNTFSDLSLLEVQYRGLCGGDSQVHQVLQTVVPPIRAIVVRLTIAEGLLLLGMYVLEQRRARSGSISPVLQYTAADCAELSSRADFRDCVAHIRRHIFRDVLEQLRATPRHEAREWMSRHVKESLFHLCHSIEDVRHESTYYLTLILNDSPIFLVEFVPTLLSLTWIVTSGESYSLREYAEVHKMAPEVTRALLPFTETTTPDRTRIGHHLGNVRTEWLNHMASECPSALVQELLGWLVNHPTRGSEALGILSSPVITQAGGSLRNLSTLVSVPLDAPLTSGEIMHRAGQHAANAALASRSSPEDHFNSVVSDIRSNYRSGLDTDSTTQNKLYALTDMIAMRYAEVGEGCEFVELGIKTLLATCRTHYYRPKVTCTTMSCCRWLMTACSNLALRILSRVVFEWQKLRDCGLGMFSSSSKRAGPCATHSAMLSFLYDYFVHTSSLYVHHDDVTTLLFSLITSTFDAPNLLRFDPVTFHPFMSCVMVGLQVSMRQAATDTRRSLVVHVLRSLFAWFSHPPIWFQLHTDDSVCRRQTALLIEISSFLPKATAMPRRDSFQSPGRRASVGSNVSGASTPSHPREDIFRPRTISLLQVLLRSELDRLCVWQRPRNASAAIHPSWFTSPLLGDEFKPETFTADWSLYVDIAFAVSPRLVVQLPNRLVTGLVPHIEKVVRRQPAAFCRDPVAVPYYLRESVVDQLTDENLASWIGANTHDALRLLMPKFATNRSVVRYALRSLETTGVDNVLHHLPQLVQALRYDRNNLVAEFLAACARKGGAHACYEMVWALRTEVAGDKTVDAVPTAFETSCQEVLDTLLSSLTPQLREQLDQEINYFDALIAISGDLRSISEGPKRKEELIRRLKQIPKSNTDTVYLPTNASMIVDSLVPEGGGVMQSAAKCPILVPFRVHPTVPSAITTHSTSSTPPTTRGLILKKGDDCRQDQLALQIISVFKDVYSEAGIPSFLHPYRVVTTAPGCGIIECVPDCYSRDQLGKMTEGNLFSFFVHKYGSEMSPAFRLARENFIQSMVAYSVVSHILNIKDRHNGNILIDAHGHVIHIDFGFIFDYSPGGDMNFESSPFKLTSEMMEVMTRTRGLNTLTVLAGLGGHTPNPASNPVRAMEHSSATPSATTNNRSVSFAPSTNIPTTSSLTNSSFGNDSTTDMDMYNCFVDGVLRCFLSIRARRDEITALVEMMLDSGLPCFKPVRTIRDLHDRFYSGHNEKEAVQYMMDRINESKQNLYTNLYDRFQYIAEGIEM